MYLYDFKDAVFVGTKGREGKIVYNGYCLQYSPSSNCLHLNVWGSKRRTN